MWDARLCGWLTLLAPNGLHHTCTTHFCSPPFHPPPRLLLPGFSLGGSRSRVSVPGPGPKPRASAASPAAPARAAASFSMAAFHDRHGGCFHGDCLVTLADGALAKVSAVGKGDSVALPGGAVGTVQCVLRTRNNVPTMPLVTLSGGLVVTPYHPVRCARVVAGGAAPTLAAPRPSA
jgi:hypothetical protein